MTVDYGYSRSNADKLSLPVETQLPEKLEPFYPFFIAFLESCLNFQQFQEKDEPHGRSIPEVSHYERRVYLHR